MAIVTGLPAPQKRAVSNFKSAATAYSYIENGIVSPVNDTLNELVGAEMPKFYVEIVEGASDYSVLSGVNGVPLGGAYHEDPTTQRGTIFAAFSDNKIYKMEGDSQTLMRDVGADGYTIEWMSAFQTVRFLYIVVGDASSSSKIYRYDPNLSIAITAIDDYSATVAGTVKVTAEHGLQTGVNITISGTTDYNGTYEIHVIDETHFYITATYTSSQTGTFIGEGIQLLEATGLVAGGRIISGMENRLLVFDAGTTVLPGQYSTLDPTMDNTDFTSGAEQLNGGSLAGGLIDVRAALYFKGLTFVFERNRITVHRIGDPFSNLTTLIKDNNTIEDGYSVEGRGTSSIEGAIIARGEIFYVDEDSGVFSYSSSGTGQNTKIGGTELSKSIHTTIVGYDLSRVALGYHPLKDVLLVACASQKGGINDTVFYYDFKTKGWSKDNTKYITKFIWNKEKKQMFGLSSITAKMVSVFDGTYFDEYGDPITLKIRSMYFDGGRESQEKEYIESSVIVGVPTLVDNFTYSLFVNSETTSQKTTTVDVTGFSSPGVQAGASGTWGESLFGGGAAQMNGNLNFVQYYNDDLVDDHRRIAMEISVTPEARFVVYAPEIVCEVIDETSDDFI